MIPDGKLNKSVSAVVEVENVLEMPAGAFCFTILLSCHSYNVDTTLFCWYRLVNRGWFTVKTPQSVKSDSTVTVSTAQQNYVKKSSVQSAQTVQYGSVRPFQLRGKEGSSLFKCYSRQLSSVTETNSNSHTTVRDH